MSDRDKRRHSRHPVNRKIKLHWGQPGGGSVQVPATCLDISRTGFRARLDRRLEPGQVVRLESPEFHLVGLCQVRHCSTQGLQFVVAMEFIGGLYWSEPQPE